MMCGFVRIWSCITCCNCTAKDGLNAALAANKDGNEFCSSSRQYECGSSSNKQWQYLASIRLLLLFAPYGAMRSNVMRHDTGRSRGFGFVHFNTRHEAQIAIDMMNGHQIGRKRLRVSFKREEPHDKIRSNIGQPPMHQMPNNNQNINNVHHAIDPNDNKNDQ
eukprot:108160_1